VNLAAHQDIVGAGLQVLVQSVSVAKSQFVISSGHKDGLTLKTSSDQFQTKT